MKAVEGIVALNVKQRPYCNVKNSFISMSARKLNQLLLPLRSGVITVLILEESSDFQHFFHGVSRFLEELGQGVSAVVEVAPHGRIFD